MKLSIIVNPTSGGGRAYKTLARHVKNCPPKDWDIEVQLTYGPGHAGSIARELLLDPPDLLAVCGGDGTFNEVVSQVPAPPFPVALLPGGTANVLAREIGLPLNPLLALDVALKRVIRRVDLGILKARTTHHFLLMAGIGFDAYVVSKVRLGLKRNAGMAAYYLATLRCLMAYPFTEFQVSTESDTVPVTSCVIANARSYGGGLVLTPKADMRDGIFDVLALQGTSKLNYLTLLLSAWLGSPRVYPWMRYLRARSLSVEGPRGPWAHVDGELTGTLPLEIGLAPASFPLVVKDTNKE